METADEIVVHEAYLSFHNALTNIESTSSSSANDPVGETLFKFGHQNKDALLKSPDELGDEIVAFTTLVVSKFKDAFFNETSKQFTVSDSAKSRYSTPYYSRKRMLYASCNCIRICTRAFSLIETAIDWYDLIELFLALAEEPAYVYNLGLDQSIPNLLIQPDWSTQSMSTRCLMNILHQSPALLSHFLELRGLVRMVTIVMGQREPVSSEYATFCVKLLYMLISKRTDLVEALHKLNILEVIVVSLSTTVKLSYAGADEPQPWEYPEHFDNPRHTFLSDTDVEVMKDPFAKTYTEVLPFPMGAESRRTFVKEAMKLLYALSFDDSQYVAIIERTNESLDPADDDDPPFTYEQLMGILGDVLCEVLHVPAYDASVFSYDKFLLSFDPSFQALHSSLVDNKVIESLESGYLFSVLQKQAKMSSGTRSVSVSDAIEAEEVQQREAFSKRIECDMLDIKKFAVQLLLRMPPSFFKSLSCHNPLNNPDNRVFHQLVYLLGLELSQPLSAASSLVYRISPLLIALSNAATHCPFARTEIKGMIFPTPFEAVRALYAAKQAESPGSELQQSQNDVYLDPLDAPVDTLRGLLIKQMVSLETEVKRSVAELLFLLCSENREEFVCRTGYGNAIALLQIKGLL